MVICCNLLHVISYVSAFIIKRFDICKNVHTISFRQRFISKADTILLDHLFSLKRPFSSNRQHLSYDGCLEVRREIIITIVVLCTEVVHSHKHI